MRKRNKVLITVGSTVLAGALALSVLYASSEYSRGQQSDASMYSPNGTVGRQTMSDNAAQRDAKYSGVATSGWYSDPIWQRQEYLSARKKYFQQIDQDTRAQIATDRVFKWPEFFFNLGAADASERWLTSAERPARQQAIERLAQSVTRALACKDTSDRDLFPAKLFGQSDSFARQTLVVARKYCAPA